MGVGVVCWTPWARRGQFAVSIKVASDREKAKENREKNQLLI